MDEQSILSELAPIIPYFPRWWIASKEEYQALHSVERQLELGKGLESHYLQKGAVALMRKDPVVSGRFRPGSQLGLEYLYFDGDPCPVAVVFGKLDVWKGMIRSHSNKNKQQDERLDGQLLLEGVKPVHLICGHISSEADDGTMQMDKIVIGEERKSGLVWYRTIWTSPGTGEIPAPQTQPPLFPQQPRFKLREPITLPDRIVGKVGTVVKQKNDEADRQRKQRRESDQENA